MLLQPLKTLLVGFIIIFILPYKASSQNTLFISPQPKVVDYEEGGYLLANNIQVYIANVGNKETLFAANNLTDKLLSSGIVNVSVTCKLLRADIVLGIISRDRELAKIINKEGLKLPANARDEGYILKISSQRIIVAAETEAGLFYGVQTLKQLVQGNRTDNKLPLLTITDWPSLRYRGWMDDISRGPIPTVDFLKECIQKMSEYKQNFFTMYTEHVFRLEQYPDIAPADGLTKEEIAELSAYALQYHIDIIGNFQSFGHMTKILGNPFYENLAENSDILNPSDEATYDFLKNIYSEIIPSYNSPFFNINCDETFGLGEGRSKKMAEKIGVDGIYAYHINRINDLIKPYGKRLMMWGDIAVNNPGIVNKLPTDLIILSWGYHAADSFEDVILPFKNSGFDFMVAPGVSCWNEVWPGMSNAAVNISNYVRDGYKLGAMGMMNTAWDDNGHNLFNSNWHGLIWGAECSWNPAPNSAGDKAIAERNNKLVLFNKCFDKQFYQKEGVTDILLSIDSLRNIPAKGILNEWTFWQDPLDFNTENTSEVAAEANRKILAKVEKIKAWLENVNDYIPGNRNMISNALLALDRIAFSARKNLLRIKVHEIMHTGNQKLFGEVRNEIPRLTNDLFAIKKEYIRLWQNENRAWWLDKNLNDYNKLAENLANLDNRVFIENSLNLTDGAMPVILSTIFNNRQIAYTIDGTEPSPSSCIYTEPLMINRNTLVKAAVVSKGKPETVTSKNILYHKGIGKLYRLNSKYSTYNPAYDAGGESGLLDGLKGSLSFYDGCWQGYQGQDLDIELIFSESIPVNTLSVDFLQNFYSWIMLPSKVEVLVSDNGTNYRSAGIIAHDIPQNRPGTIIHNFRFSLDNITTRYLKIIAHYPGDLPLSHQAPGNPSFIFADEIVIE